MVRGEQNRRWRGIRRRRNTRRVRNRTRQSKNHRNKQQIREERTRKVGSNRISFCIQRTNLVGGRLGCVGQASRGVRRLRRV